MGWKSGTHPPIIPSSTYLPWTTTMSFTIVTHRTTTIYCNLLPFFFFSPVRSLSIQPWISSSQQISCAASERRIFIFKVAQGLGMARKRLKTTKALRASSSQLHSEASQHCQNNEQSVSSTNNVEHVTEEVEEVIVQPKPKKIRGYTRMAEIWDLDKEEQIIVVVNAHHIPIGDAAAKLSRFIGTMVRMSDFAPLTYTIWPDVPVRKKEEMWEIVKEKFQFRTLDGKEVTEGEAFKCINVWTLENMSAKWRTWKNELKNMYFDDALTPLEMHSHVHDSRVNKDQFISIATHWLTDEAKEQSTKNKENCSKSKEPHCTGTKSFPRLIHEMAEESNGIQPSRAKVYVRTRTRKNGSIVNDNTAEVVEQMKQKMSETTMESEGTSWDNDVYAQVKGPEKRGYVRCMRTKIKRSNSCGSSCTQQRRKNDEVETMKAEICGLKTALNHVLSIMKKRFPEDELSNLIIGQIPEGNSAPHVPPDENNRSSESSHQMEESEI